MNVRQRVRGLLAAELGSGRIIPHCDAWLTGFDPDFSARLGAAGLIGVNMPTNLGGAGMTLADRRIIGEELLAAGAPVAAHWFAERQMAPSFLRHGSREQQLEWIPRIVKGQAYFAVGLSEPDSGSDLGSLRTKATRVPGGWLLTGTKLWVSGAHHAHAIVVLARSAESMTHLHGLTQFVVRLPNAGVEIRPVRFTNEAHHFNEVIFDQAFISDEDVLGKIGNGWEQAMQELSFERAGPERYLSTLPLLQALVASEASDAQRAVDSSTSQQLGRVISTITTLRTINEFVSTALTCQDTTTVEIPMLKALGTEFEQGTLHLATSMWARQRRSEQGAILNDDLMREARLQSPGFTIRGGTNEILRGIVSKRLAKPVPRLAPEYASTTLRWADLRAPIIDVAERIAHMPTHERWSALVDTGLDRIGISEQHNGSGGDLADIASVVSTLARFNSSPLLAESSMLAAWALSECGLDLPALDRTGRAIRLTAAFDAGQCPTAERTAKGWQVTGQLRDVPYLREADLVVMPVLLGHQLGILQLPVSKLQIECGENWAGESRDCASMHELTFALDAVAPVPENFSLVTLKTRGALVRALQISGALQAIRDLSVQYANDRVQFGKPLAAMQVIQSYLARIAEQVLFAEAAVSTAIGSPSEWNCGIAKAVTGRAGMEVAQLAHQIHGAIGMSGEYPLGRYSARVWAWSEEYGRSDDWEAQLGCSLFHTTAPSIWRSIVDADTHMGALR